MQAMGGRGQDSKANLRAVGRLGVPEKSRRGRPWRLFVVFVRIDK